MIIEFDKSFLKSLEKIKDKNLYKRVEQLIIKIEETNNLEDISSCKKLSGFDNYYRIRLGNYRIGIEKRGNDIIRLIIILHRKDIYKQFP